MEFISVLYKFIDAYWKHFARCNKINHRQNIALCVIRFVHVVRCNVDIHENLFYAFFMYIDI